MSAPFPYPYAILVSDGAVMRGIHQGRLSPADRAAVEAVLTRVFLHEPPVAAEPARSPAAAVTIDTMTQREIATAQGFTGDTCPTCGSFAMKRAGTCTTCSACGSTSGCG